MSNLNMNDYHEINIEWIILVQLGDIPNIQTFGVKYIIQGTKKRWNLVLKDWFIFQKIWKLI